MDATIKQLNERDFHKEIFELTKICGGSDNWALWFHSFKSYIELRDELKFSEIKESLNDIMNQNFFN